MSSSNRWLLQQWYKCQRCTNIRRVTNGYRPIPNPMLYDALPQENAYHAEMRRSVADRGCFMLKCDKCGVHNNWHHLTFQDQDFWDAVQTMHQGEERDQVSSKPGAVPKVFEGSS